MRVLQVEASRNIQFLPRYLTIVMQQYSENKYYDSQIFLNDDPI